MRHGRVAEIVEVQQHQHSQRAIGERERPIAGSDQSVVPDLHRVARVLCSVRREAATLAASSAIRWT